jgi:hypothetical protein
MAMLTGSATVVRNCYQFILLVEILEVVISGMFAYGVQISIFAGLATVFAVLGVDQ